MPAIKELVDIYAGRILLEKNLVTLYEGVQEFWVAERDGELIGCGALHVLWADLGEVRTVAVHPKVKGQGVGHLIVDRLLGITDLPGGRERLLGVVVGGSGGEIRQGHGQQIRSLVPSLLSARRRSGPPR